jgi:hypothetical protein
VLPLLGLALSMLSAKKRLRHEHGDDVTAIVEDIENTVATLVAAVAIRSLRAASQRSGFFARFAGPPEDTAVRAAVANEFDDPRLDTLENLHGLLRDRHWTAGVIDSLIRRCHLVAVGATLTAIGVAECDLHLALPDISGFLKPLLLPTGLLAAGLGSLMMVILWLSVVHTEGRISDMKLTSRVAPL